jgi:signal peptidase I
MPPSMKPPADDPATPPFKKSVPREYLESVVVAVILALFIRTFVVQAFKIPTGSMETNLLVGDHLLVNKVVYSPSLGGLENAVLPKKPIRRGHVIVFKVPQNPPQDFIKRVIGLPGETVEIRNKVVYIDGKPLEEPYIKDKPLYFFSKKKVPEGEFFVLGDNRNNSFDSHVWDFLPREYLIGKAWVSYWPVQAWAVVQHTPIQFGPAPAPAA